MTLQSVRETRNNAEISSLPPCANWDEDAFYQEYTLWTPLCGVQEVLIEKMLKTCAKIEHLFVNVVGVGRPTRLELAPAG